AAYQGSFGQTKGVNWAKFAGVLNEPEFHEVHDHIGGMRKAGRAGMARSLGRTKAGYKHKGGNTAQRERDARSEADLVELRATVEAQNAKILELEDQIPEPDIVTSPGEPAPPGDGEPIGQLDEGNLV
ncbi:MAG: hypothetical protein ACXABY_17645, partial [Candidatus Thorarchaeota archaeon]